MKYFYSIFISLFLIISSAFADGTKQLMPNRGTEENPMPKGNCYIVIGAQEGGNGPSRPFARYNPDGTSADTSARLYINIRDYNTETIRFGFSDIFAGENSAADASYGKIDQSDYSNLKFRIKDPNGNVVFSERSMPKSGDGYIESYAEAYKGPKNGSNGGYDFLELQPTMNGNYYIEFCNDRNIGTTGSGQNATIIGLFDVSVCDKSDNYKQKEGRLWSYAWSLNTDNSANETWTSFYTMSTDKYVSKVYLSGFKPYQFVIACNSYGSKRTGDMEKDRQSIHATSDPSKDIPEYQVFLTCPSDEEWGKASLPHLPENLTFAGDAMTCEDLIFVVQLLYNENAQLELHLDTDDDGVADRVIASLLQANIAKDRGYHYPWKDSTELRKTGMHVYNYSPITEGCSRKYSLSLFDQTYKYEYDISLAGESEETTDRVNPGDLVKVLYTDGDGVDDSKYTPNKPFGSSENPIILSNKDDFDRLATAVNTGGDYTFTIENYYCKKDDGVTTCYPRTFTIKNDEENAGFKNTYFYCAFNTGTVTLDATWQGIGTEEKPFKGHFGAGRYVENPVNVKSETDIATAGDQDTIIFSGATCGLFNYCDGATIDNIHVKGSISAGNGNSFGAICGTATNTTFEHCTNHCTISSNTSNTGGIVGTATQCAIDSCYNYGNLTSTNSSANVGGIAGHLQNGEDNELFFCYNSGTVSGGANTGGIIGYAQNDGSSISYIYVCKNVGDVSGDGVGGGIVGRNEAYTISQCYNSGSIDGYAMCFSYAPEEENDEDENYLVSLLIEDCLNVGETNALSNGGAIFNSLSNAAYYNGGDGMSAGSIEDLLEEIGCGVDTETEDTDNSDENDTTGEETGGSTDPSSEEESGCPFYYDGAVLDLHATLCCGSIWRMEDAGRLYQNDSTFYVKWDGKDSDGECVTGDVEVNYQKNSGVTHFPFYDSEKSGTNMDKEPGLVVYRMSPIKEEEKGSSQYGKLPKEYFQSTNYDENEKGLQLRLFWDDTQISLSGSCTLVSKNVTETIDITTDNGDGTKTVTGSEEQTVSYRVGETISGATKVTETKYCISWSPNGTKVNKKKTDNACSKTSSVTIKGKKYTYCKTWAINYSEKKNCTAWQVDRQETIGKSECHGIENVSDGGYYGSLGGGHIFPIDNFGNENVINTWWNGVEMVAKVPLVLTENSPAVIYTFLPIVINSWEVTNLEKTVMLEWATASEDNNDYFAIERSIDGCKWTTLGKVNGSGTTSITNYYSFEDTKPVSGIAYYRLKQVDFNGEYTYSSVKCVNRPNDKKDVYKVYTLKNENAFIVEGDEIAACPIEIYNAAGVKITTVSFNTTSTSRVVINVADIPVGTYFIKSCNNTKAVVKTW